MKQEPHIVRGAILRDLSARELEALKSQIETELHALEVKRQELEMVEAELDNRQ